MLNCEFGGHSPYKDYIGHIVDAVDDPITQGMGDYIVSDELCEPRPPLPPDARLTLRQAGRVDRWSCNCCQCTSLQLVCEVSSLPSIQSTMWPGESL